MIAEKSQPALLLQNVQFSWSDREAFSLEVPAFAMDEGESVLVLGESGAGKSTLLSLICGTVVAKSGCVKVADTEIAKLSRGQRDRFRGETIGMIFQQFNLLPFASVLDNILLPLHFAPKRRKRAGDPRAEAQRLCEILGLPNDLNAKAANISVGQQQRVAVARALIGKPPLIIADEPTSALDANSQTAFLELLFEQVRSNETTLLMVSHDPRLGDKFDRVVRIEDIAA